MFFSRAQVVTLRDKICEAQTQAQVKALYQSSWTLRRVKVYVSFDNWLPTMTMFLLRPARW
jgi:hypothetical protein